MNDLFERSEAPTLRGDTEFRTTLAATVGERRRAHDFGLHIALTDPRYGAISEEWFRRHYPEPEKYEFVEALDGDRIVGSIRVILPYSLDPYTNLLPEFEAALRQPNRVADVGIYIDHPPTKALPVLVDLWAYFIAFARHAAATLIYAQVRDEQAGEWELLGFERATELFHVPGWRGVWTGMWIDLERACTHWDSREFAEKQKARTGRPFYRGFWERVVRLQSDPDRWDVRA